MQLRKRTHTRQRRCWYCGETLSRETFTRDHQRPISRGGADSITNLVSACHKCNQAKANLTLDHFRELMKFKHGKGFQFYGEIRVNDL